MTISPKILSASMLLMGAFFFAPKLYAQEADTTYAEEEFDFSMYDDLDFVEEGAKRYATSKVKGLSPARLISIGYDYQGAYDIEAAAISSPGGLENNSVPETMTVNATHGLRLEANIPIISKNSIIVQGGFTYWETNYSVDDPGSLTNDFNRLLANYNHRTTGLNTTIFKPFNETRYMIIQASADLNGDYDRFSLQNLKYTRYSIAALYGSKPNDRKMIAFGLARTYRVGELNYIPIMLLNWTHVNEKWGAEVLAPARAHLRYTVSPRTLWLFGYELQGQSYRINNSGTARYDFNNLELRRGELRFRTEYQRQLNGFIWLSAQLGYRINYSFNVDDVPDGDEFFRGFFGDQPYIMENTAGNPWYLNFTISLVSP